MIKIKINKSKFKKVDIKLIASYLKKGKTILYPTDTIYGLGCSAADKKAINKIYKIKRRSWDRPLIVLASSLKMVKKYAFLSRAQAAYLKKVWPGPVTVILASRQNLPKELFGRAGYSGGLAVRLPKNKFLIKLVAAVGLPIVSTSANIHKQKNITAVNQAGKVFKKYKPDLAVDGGVLNGKASKLVDIRDIKNIKILRK